MELFPPAPETNLLPRDGTVLYHGPILPAAEADELLRVFLHTIPWKNDEAVIFGKRIITARMVAWYGDSEFPYTYSGTTKCALPWTDELRALKARVETLTGHRFNSCLLNLYHHGGEGMTWHSDDEKSLVPDGCIASASLGAARKFSFKHKRTKETVSLVLDHGSLLEMKGATQTHWLHALPKTAKIQTPRVNLTFRRMREA